MKKDPNLLENYWPVVFISMFLRFLRELFKNKSRITLMTFYHLLCGYEKSSSCQYALLSFIGKSKMSLHKKEYARAVLMDLWKAFDTINYVLIIAKLHVYGFSKNSLKLLQSYMSDRWKKTKIVSRLVLSWNYFRVSSWPNFIQHVSKWFIFLLEF